MKHILRFIILQIGLIAERDKFSEEEIPKEVFSSDVHYPPLFMGGNLERFHKWIQLRVKYPEEARKKEIVGRVFVEFTINNDGTMGDVEVVQSPDESLSREALRVIKSSPKWSTIKFHKEGGVRFTLPVEFRGDTEGN